MKTTEMGSTRVLQWTVSAILLSMIILEMVVAVHAYDGPLVHYGNSWGGNINNREYINNNMNSGRNWRKRNSRRRQNKNKEQRQRDYDPKKYENGEDVFYRARRKEMEGEENYYIVKSEDSCCPVSVEQTEPMAGRNRSGHLVDLYQDDKVRQRIYEISCAKGVANKPCKFLDSRYSAMSRCVQQHSYTYALVRPPGGTVDDQPWSLDYIHIRSGCACEIVNITSGRRKNKKRNPIG